MKTSVAFGVLSFAAACAASTLFAQQMSPSGAYRLPLMPISHFQEVGVEPMAEDDALGNYAGGACGTGSCSTGCCDSLACGSCCNSCGCESCCCDCGYVHRSGIFGEFLLIRPRDQEIAFAVPGQAPTIVNGQPQIAVPQGATLVLDPDYQPGYRVGVVGALDERTSVMLAYTTLEAQTETGRTLTADEIAQNMSMFPLLLHPRAILPDQVTNVATQGRMDVDFDILDLDTRMLLYDTDTIAINGFGGARWANLDHVIEASYGVNGATIVKGGSQYDGLGARGGLDGEFRSQSGFGAYGRGAMSLMYGAGRGDYLQYQINNQANPQVFTNAKYDRLSPILDFEMGVDWVSPGESVRFALGYMTSVWFNMVTARDYMNGVITNQFDDFSDTVTFDGLTARAEVRF